MPKVSMNITDQRRALDVSFGDDFRITIVTDDLERVIWMLADKRSRMEPPVAGEPPPGIVAAPNDPRWQVTTSDGNTILRIRDPRFGWLRFALSPDEALSLARALSL